MSSNRGTKRDDREGRSVRAGWLDGQRLAKSNRLGVL